MLRCTAARSSPVALPPRCARLLPPRHVCIAAATAAVRSAHARALLSASLRPDTRSLLLPQEEFIASQPEGYCVNSGTRNFLYLTISVSNGVGTPAVASGDPLLCPCLPSGTACDGGLLCTDEGPNSWCCENYVPAYLGPRRLVTPPGGSDYCK